MKIFRDWRELDQTLVNLNFKKGYIYYVHSRAWALKGWCGGTHAWITMWSEEYSKWIVVELTDRETITVQQGSLIWVNDNMLLQEYGPIISDRINNAKWFGSTPSIVGKAAATVSLADLVDICQSYPLTGFNLVTRNCNTFISYVIYRLKLNIRRPMRSVGFKSKRYWSRHGR